MELQRDHYRAMIFYGFEVSLTQEQRVEKLVLVFGEETRFRATLCRWRNFGEVVVTLRKKSWKKDHAQR